jgi:anti-sigma factor RsiW
MAYHVSAQLNSSHRPQQTNPEESRMKPSLSLSDVLGAAEGNGTAGYHRYAMWDVAYLLGSLSAGDRREFETHMADCPPCRQAVVDISALPAMLSQFDGDDIAAINASGHASQVSAMPSALLPSLLAAVRRRGRRSANGFRRSTHEVGPTVNPVDTLP